MYHRQRAFLVLAIAAAISGIGGCGRTPPAATKTPPPKAARSPDDLLVSAGENRSISAG
jgi:hypothetical protein